MCVQNLKYVASPIPEITVSSQKNWAVPGYAHAPFSPKFVTGFRSDGPVNVSAKFAARSLALSVPEIIAIAVLGCGCEPPILGKGRPRDGTVRKSVGEFL